ncbi:DtxR family Mn-dependent transcriptional regulator [Motilibacter peucedani]|uniref:DtxR family Mn-dependent transcriptional regulator n=1 Tax=Motilibacter peucedani TaxID=598650 RepID=A0A420XKM3_9ACTN|nr:metal-dependent transcriptional regulator [Motilibacter peucedani]RKS68560.1 DtxR family Mn-dependent transcriptional regulator [Motilibacter peucedani]
MSDLIDTTEMYLRTIYELEEEGVPPMRARIAERLGQSGPTVSQTVSRMQRGGLVDLGEGNRLVLTAVGQATAMRVMRKHRLAECLLVSVIGLDWEHVHEEACRWEHVMSEAVERRLLELLDHPTHSPYGNPIPGLDELGDADPHEAFREGLVPLPSAAVSEETRSVVVRRLGEPVHDPDALAVLRRIGVQPGAVVSVRRTPTGVLVASGGESAELTDAIAAHVFVAAGSMPLDVPAGAGLEEAGLADAGFEEAASVSRG